MRWLVACSVLVTSCDGAPPSIVCSGGGFGTGGGAGGGPAEQILLVGKPETVTLTLAPQVTCSGNVPPATDVETGVSGPDNRPVNHQHGAPSTASFNGYSVTVTFTPERAGSYHVTARFQPNLGTAQFDVRAAQDRTLQPVDLTLSTMTSCDHLDVTASRAVLCSSFGSTRVFRGDTQVDMFDSDVFAISGDVVWIGRFNSVERKHDDGTGALMPMVPSMLTVLGTPRALTGSADDVVVALDTTVARWQVSGGTFVPRETWQYSAFGSDSAVVRSADGLVVGSSSSLCTTAGADAGTLSCRNVGMIGVDARGIWTRDLNIGETSVADLYVPGRQSPVQSVPAPASLGTWTIEAQSAPRAGPYGIAYQDGEAVLAKWVGSDVLYEVTGGWAVLSSTSNGVFQYKFKRVP